MSAWDDYAGRFEVHGTTKRSAALIRYRKFSDRHLPDSLSYQTVEMEGVETNVAILNSDNLNEKYIYSMPGGDLDLGGLVLWEENYWLITELDAANEVYARGKMIQCNYLLKWIDDEHVIHEQWCIVEDGTKYLTGELEDRHFIVTRGDTRMYLTIGRNEHTAKLTRQNRFLIDDPDSPNVMAYQLTKPLKVGTIYGMNKASLRGVYKFVIQEVDTTDDDNLEELIPDYYKHFPAQKPDPSPPTEPGPVIGSDGKENWL